MTNHLGRLERIDLRSVWNNEAAHFTPWLAEEENLALLGETLGLELELQQAERAVGPFSADIVCKETISEHLVLIENQLERTDHTHLGQLLTYAAGLEAVTIVWVAASFTDEHRAALDWLNEVTNERAAFFGLEVELWRIGDSPPAPKFNIVSQPNEWTRARRTLGTGDLSDLRAMQLAYWSELMALLHERPGPISPRQPRPGNCISFAVGRSYFNLHAYVSTSSASERRVGVRLVIWGPDAKPHFAMLRSQREQIEAEVGTPLDWREMPDRIQSRAALENPNMDPTDREDWPRQHQWLAEKLQAFHRVFSDRIRGLDAGSYRPNEGE